MPELNGQQFSDFGESKYGRLGTDPTSAAGKCASVSHEFTQHLRRTGHPTDQDRYLQDYHLHVFEGHPNTPTGHVAPVLGGYVIDWTAKQLDPALGHPHVEPFESYRKRFASDRAYQDYNGEQGWRDEDHPRR